MRVCGDAKREDEIEWIGVNKYKTKISPRISKESLPPPLYIYLHLFASYRVQSVIDMSTFATVTRIGASHRGDPEVTKPFRSLVQQDHANRYLKRTLHEDVFPHHSRD